MSHHCIRGTIRTRIRTTAYRMNARTIAFVPKEDPQGTYSSFKIFLMQTILIHTFSRLLAVRLFP